jgi:hypothetical protein
LEFVSNVHIILCETSGSHGGKYEDSCLLGCCAMHSGTSLLTFQGCLLPPSSVCPDDGGSKHFWNVRKLLLDYRAQEPIR